MLIYSLTEDPTADNANTNKADVSGEETTIEEMQGGNGENEVCLYDSKNDTLFTEFSPQLESTGLWDPLNR